jgi:hypothetical protein
MVDKLVKGTYKAIISDSTQLISIVNSDESCHLHLLPEAIEPFDIAFAYADDHQHLMLAEAIDAVIVELQESGTLAVCLPCMHVLARSRCASTAAPALCACHLHALPCHADRTCRLQHCSTALSRVCAARAAMSVPSLHVGAVRGPRSAPALWCAVSCAQLCCPV